MKHRDIDFHIYSPSLNIADSFAAMTRIAANPRIRRIEYGNLLDAPDQCLEWHAWYADADDRLWQIDMIPHGPRIGLGGLFRTGGRPDRRRADRRETRRAILQIKYDTPDEVKIMGIEYYQAVLRDGVRTMPNSRHGARRIPSRAFWNGCPESQCNGRLSGALRSFKSVAATDRRGFHP